MKAKKIFIKMSVIEVTPGELFKEQLGGLIGLM
jgi:hypothetical protein